ncbi:hypothetical protein R3P38DRAFT_2728647 [Favolaschia claudopus]|uniref:F-box domain-containing protein n=1 Tax=Favolaschia claudopus TaxID=2862362 RepID=A0AAW0AC57_9AGAR
MKISGPPQHVFEYQLASRSQSVCFFFLFAPKAAASEIGMPSPAILDNESLQDALREQATALRAQMDALHSRTTILDAKKVALRRELEAVMLEEAGCQKEMALVDRTLTTVLERVSHIFRIPREILTEIFRWTLWPEYTRVVGIRIVPIPPWKLGHICRYWRETAQADPRLWSDIVIDCTDSRQGRRPGYYGSPPYNPVSEYPLEALATQLRLSGTGCVSVEFRLEVYKPVQHPSYMMALLNTLIAESNRWIRFTMGCRTDHLGGVFDPLSQVCGRLDRLQYLYVGGGDSEWPKQLNDAFSVAPNLQEVYLSLNLSNRAPGPSICWAQLTKLDITAEADFLLDSLRLAENLRELVFTDSLGVEGPHPDSSRITQSTELPELRRLSLKKGTWILRYLYTPKLEYLEVDWESDAIAPFVVRSRCNLHSLNVGSTTSANIITVLRMSPDLFHLEIADEDGYKWYDELLTEVFSALTLKGTSTDICLNLVSLRFDSAVPSARSSAYAALCNMLHSRRRVPPHLQSLKSIDIGYCALDYTEPHWEQLDAFRRDGLDIVGLGEPPSDTSDDEDDF